MIPVKLILFFPCFNLRRQTDIQVGAEGIKVVENFYKTLLDFKRRKRYFKIRYIFQTNMRNCASCFLLVHILRKTATRNIVIYISDIGLISADSSNTLYKKQW